MECLITKEFLVKSNFEIGILFSYLLYDKVYKLHFYLSLKLELVMLNLVQF